MALFSRGHYETLSAALRERIPDSETNTTGFGFYLAVVAVIDALERDNPGFDRKRFINDVYKLRSDDNGSHAHAKY